MMNYFCACLFSVSLFGTYLLHGQHLVLLKDGQNDIPLSGHAYKYTGQPFLDSISMLLHADPKAFELNLYPLEVNYGFAEPAGWCRLSIRNESHQQEWVLKIQQSRVDTVQLYVIRGNSIERLPMTGHFQITSQRPLHSLPFAYPIHFEENETITLFLYSQRQFGRHAAVLNFQPKEYFESYEYRFNVGIGFVSGMVVLAAMLGFFLFLFVRQKVYVYYSIYTISFFMLLMVDTGFAHGMLSFPHHQIIANGFTIAFFYWFCGWHILFAIELLRMNQYGKRWVYWSGITMGCFSCLAAVLLLIPGLPLVAREGLVRFSYYIVFIGNIFIFYTVAISVLKAEPIVYFYMAGFYYTCLVGLFVTLSDFEILNIQIHNKDWVYLTPLVEILCVALGIGIHFARTLRERMDVQLALNQTQEQIITIQEDERRRIAQDLHDDVGNSLAAIKNMVIHHHESLVVEKEIDNIIATIRTISHDLMPVDFGNFSLVDILGHTVRKFKDHPSIVIEFDCTGKEVKFKPLVELVIYRVINELINNILKHSKATKAFIQLLYQAGSLVVTVEDNGIGMNNSTTVDGIGLRSIQSRAAYIRAALKIESDQNKGTLIILEIPYESN